MGVSGMCAYAIGVADAIWVWVAGRGSDKFSKKVGALFLPDFSWHSFFFFFPQEEDPARS